MHSTYDIPCPICDDENTIKVGETQTIYYIETYQNRNSVRNFLMKSKPVEKVGNKELVDDKWVEVDDLICNEGHISKVYYSHYTKIKPQNQIYGPESKPSIYCPKCSFDMGKHEKHIIKLDSSPEMQYVLRSVSLSESPNHKLSHAVTKKVARKYDQICISMSCDHCNSDVYFNYSSKNINSSESYNGVRSIG